MVLKFLDELYSKNVVFKSAYKFIDDFYIHIDKMDHYYIISITAKNKNKELSESEFMNEMLIQQTRELVADKTKKIRELMYARALASTVIEDEYDEKIEDNDSADDILMDWFEKYE